MTEKDERALRLAAQLRDNLRKRKARARDLAAGEPVSAGDAECPIRR